MKKTVVCLFAVIIAVSLVLTPFGSSYAGIKDKVKKTAAKGVDKTKSSAANVGKDVKQTANKTKDKAKEKAVRADQQAGAIAGQIDDHMEKIIVGEKKKK